MHQLIRLVGVAAFTLTRWASDSVGVLETVPEVEECFLFDALLTGECLPREQVLGMYWGQGRRYDEFSSKFTPAPLHSPRNFFHNEFHPQPGWIRHKSSHTWRQPCCLSNTCCNSCVEKKKARDRSVCRSSLCMTDVVARYDCLCLLKFGFRDA